MPRPATISELMKPGNTAVITGASSGIGRAASLTFAKAGMHVWMVDIDSDELLAAQTLVKKEAQHNGQMILSEVIDVSRTDDIERLASQVFSGGGKCHILMNNAAIHAAPGTTDTSALAAVSSYERVVNVNTFGPIYGCIAFIPRMKESGEPGIIINTGSKQGITMPPGNLPYNVSKAALKCYTEGLEHELRQSNNLRALLLVPGWTNTSILAKHERSNALAKGDTYDPSKVFFSEVNPQPGAWNPSQVIHFMIQEADKGSFYVICPDNDVTQEVDNLRMTWTMQDITDNRPPLSRWHPNYKDKFDAFLHANKLG